VLVDCGMVQGGRDAPARNRAPWGFHPASLTAVVLTHAHIDHSGLLPRLVAEGYAGSVFATPATIELIGVMLRDSAHLQLADAARVARRGGPRVAATPLYGFEEVEALMRRMVPLPYGETRGIAPGVRLRLSDAGHILGSALVELWLENGSERCKLVMTGDLGQPGRPILRDPTVIEDADVLVLESTYGDRDHKPLAATLDELVESITRTLVQRHGNVIVPSFAVGRTQELLYWFERLALEGRLPPLDVFVDSPLANEVTAITARHFELFDAEARRLRQAVLAGQTRCHIRETHSVEESMALNRLAGGAVIVAASGMCDGGRIRHHLKHHLPNPHTTVLIVGFQAAGTLGRRLVDRSPSVTISGTRVPVRAQIVTLGGFSAHADQSAILAWLRNFRRPPRTWLVHGEPGAASTLATRIGADLAWPEVHVAQLGDVAPLGRPSA
jgi:metallo-beta-lactamase family protein